MIRYLNLLSVAISLFFHMSDFGNAYIGDVDRKVVNIYI